MRSETAVDPEFSFVVHPSEIGENEKIYELQADSVQREALARRFDLLEIEFFKARMVLRRRQGGATLHLLGCVTARVIQRCVLTLEPVGNDVDHQFESIFSEENQNDRNEVTLDDDVEPLDGDILDLGEVASEELFLALDPYPRVPGVALTDFLPEADSEEDNKHPFAALAALKGRK